MIVTAGISFSANGAATTTSYSTGRFLSGSIGGTNLDALAQARGVTATNPGNAGPNKNNLDLTLLSAIPINVPGGINLDVAKLLGPSGAAGLVSQYASAESTKKAIGASGAISDSGAVLTTSGGVPTDAKISLKGGPLAGISDNLASVDLGLGALSSNTTVDGGTPSRSYNIAGLNLQLGVPLLGDLVSDLNGALSPLAAGSSDIADINNIQLSASRICPLVSDTLNVTVNTLNAQLTTLGLGGLVTALEPILTTLQLGPTDLVNLCDTGLLGQLTGLTAALDDLIKIQVTGLGDLFTGISNFSDGGVDVDLNTGTITLDLAKILKAAGADLNNLPPNTDIVKYLTSDLISGKITSVLNSAIANITTNIGKVKVDVTLAGTAIPTLSLTEVTTPLNTLLTQVTAAIAAIGKPIDDLLGQLAPSLKQIVSLTGNNQSTSKTPTLGTGTVKAGSFGAAAVGDYYRTSALKIDVLTNVLNLDIAASEAATLAGPNTPDDAGPGQAAAVANDDAPSDNANAGDSDANADADNGDSDAVADADAQADADVTTTLPSTGAPNLLPFWLLGIALLLFGGAVLLNEKRRLNQV
ncbi:choice-of-anchor G family protein [Aeromicrobium fastidiosum]|nr:choice-of-anchor G family protein [Aeromicrobium fastidiosum]